MYCRFIGLFKLQKLDESKVGYRENNNSWVSAMVKIGVWLRLIRLLLPRYPNQSMQRDIAPTDDIDTRDTCKKHRRTHDIAKKLKVTMSYVSRFGLTRLYRFVFLRSYRNVHNFRCLGEDVLHLLIIISYHYHQASAKLISVEYLLGPPPATPRNKFSSWHTPCKK